MKVTMNGLDNPEFDSIRRQLIDIGELISKSAAAGKGHLSDQIALIRTSQSHLNLIVDKLIEIRNSQI